MIRSIDAGPPAVPGARTTGDDANLALLTIAYPAFTITCHPHGSRTPRWEAVRKNAADPGRYAIDP